MKKVWIVPAELLTISVNPNPTFTSVKNSSRVSRVRLFCGSLTITWPTGFAKAKLFEGSGSDTTLSLSNWG